MTESNSNSLEPKEGILLDRDGTPLTTGAGEIRGRAFSVGPWIGSAFLLVLVFAGMTFFGVLLALLLGGWLIRSLFRILGLSSPRRNPGPTTIHFTRRG